MQQKKIIIFLIVLFLASSVWLFYVSGKIMNPDEGKSWWALYFSNPKSTNNLDFIIENHSETQEFSWKILEKNKILREGNERIEKGEKKEIKDEGNFKNRITIQVNVGDSKKEIYKNFDK